MLFTKCMHKPDVNISISFDGTGLLFLGVNMHQPFQQEVSFTILESDKINMSLIF